MAVNDVTITGIYGQPSQRSFLYNDYDHDDVEIISVTGFPLTTARIHRPALRSIRDTTRDRSRSPILRHQSPLPNPASARLRLSQTPRSPSPENQHSDLRVVRFFEPLSSPLEPLVPADQVDPEMDDNGANDDDGGEQEDNVDNNDDVGGEQEDNNDNNIDGDDEEVDDDAYDVDTELDDNSDVETCVSDDENVVSSNTEPQQIKLGLYLDDDVLEDRIIRACDNALVRRPVGPIRRLVPSSLHKYIKSTILNSLVLLGGSYVGQCVVYDLIAPLNDGLHSIRDDDNDSVCSEDSGFATTSTTSPLSVIHTSISEDQFNNPKVYEHILNYLNNAPNDLRGVSLSTSQRDTRLAIAAIHPLIFNLLIDHSEAFESAVCTNPLRDNEPDMLANERW